MASAAGALCAKAARMWCRVWQPRRPRDACWRGAWQNEDLQGRPFVGAAGHYLTDLLALAGLSRDEVFIANVLKCRPPSNRDPHPDEIVTCTPYLRDQVAPSGRNS